MRTLAILGGVLAGLAVILVGGSYVLLKPAAISAELAQTIKDSTGYTISVSGPSEFSLWPEASVTLQKVSLESAKSVAGAAPLSAEKLVIVTTYSALFSGAFEPKSVEATGVRLNLLIDGKGNASWPAKALHLPVPLKITNGSIAFLDERSGSSFTASELSAMVATGGSGEDLQSYGQFVWRKQPVRFTLQLKSLARLMEDGSPVSMTANGPLVDFYFDGRAGFTKGLALAGQASVNSDDLRGLSRWLGVDLQPGYGLSSFTMSGAIDSRGPATKITRATILLDETTAKGSLNLDVAGRIPLVTGTLVADQVDLATYLGEPEKPSAEWSTAPLSFAGIAAFDAAIDVSADVATYGDLEFRNLVSRIEQRNGVFEAAISQMSIGVGACSAQIRLDAADTVPVLAINFTGENVESQDFLRNLFGFSALKGKATISAALRGSGKSQAELISTLKGTAAITMADGSFERVDPGALLSQVSTRIVEGWQGDSSAHFKDLGASFAVEDGIASISTMAYAEGTLSMTIKGETDLLRRAVNFRVEPTYHGSGAATAAWPVPVAISGPWARPKIYPDIAGLPANPAEGFQKLRTMGLPVLPSPPQN